MRASLRQEALSLTWLLREFGHSEEIWRFRDPLPVEAVAHPLGCRAVHPCRSHRRPQHLPGVQKRAIRWLRWVAR